MATTAKQLRSLLVMLVAVFLFLCVASAATAGKTRKEKVSRLSFYFHDIVAGSNKSVAQAVAPAKGFPNAFGTINVIDDPLTQGPTLDSPRVGSAQGLYTSASCTGQGNIRLLMAMNFVFDSGKYNGSTLAVLGSNAVLREMREMPVVGGSGLFRFARGYAQARTHIMDFKTGNAVVHYDVTVMHF